MRILLWINLLFFSFMIKTDAIGVEELKYTFYVVPQAGPEAVEFAMFLRNEGEIPLNFEFPSSHIYDITVTDQSGREVYDYSKGRYFLQAFQSIRLQPQQTIINGEKWNCQFQGKRVPAGEYNVHVTLKPVRLNGDSLKKRAKLNDTQKFFVPEENTAFRKLMVSGTNGTYIVTGESNTKQDSFYYTVEDGHVEIIKERNMALKGGNQEWEPFKLDIHLPEKKLPVNGTLMLNLYERNSGGDIIHLYPLVLERFNYN